MMMAHVPITLSFGKQTLIDGFNYPPLKKKSSFVRVKMNNHEKGNIEEKEIKLQLFGPLPIEGL